MARPGKSYVLPLFARLCNDPNPLPEHEACFLDRPRLSTLQALLLLLKARESVPKRGYYYRSWMTCKTAVTMAKDLELHEHHDIHAAGESCGSDSVECLTKTRVWQSLLVCETMVGAPQGESVGAHCTQDLSLTILLFRPHRLGSRSKLGRFQY